MHLETAPSWRSLVTSGFRLSENIFLSLFSNQPPLKLKPELTVKRIDRVEDKFVGTLTKNWSCAMSTPPLLALGLPHRIGGAQSRFVYGAGL